MTRQTAAPKRARPPKHDPGCSGAHTPDLTCEEADRLYDGYQQAATWDVQWIDGDGKPFGRYWPGKTESVRTVTNNHARGDGRAQLLNRLVSEPAIADVEIVGVEGAGDD